MSPCQYHDYTKSLSQYHECCQYHEYMSIPWVLVNSKRSGENITIIHVFVSFNSLMGHIVWSLILVATSKKGFYSASFRLLMFSKKMQNFELHPQIPQIHTKIMVYGNGVLIKHIKPPAIVKVEFTDLWKVNCVTMRNRVKYLNTNSNIGCMSAFVSATMFRIFLCHSAIIFYKKKFSSPLSCRFLL